MNSTQKLTQDKLEDALYDGLVAGWNKIMEDYGDRLNLSKTEDQALFEKYILAALPTVTAKLVK